MFSILKTFFLIQNRKIKARVYDVFRWAHFFLIHNFLGKGVMYSSLAQAWAIQPSITR